MEENLHNDGLEDFLKKSFEQYDDSPSDGLWDKIEADLDLPAAVVPMHWRWYIWASAAAILLLAVVLGQHFYYGQKLDKLAQKIEATNEALNSLKAENNELKQALESTKMDLQAPESKLLETQNPAWAAPEKNTEMPATSTPLDIIKPPIQNSTMANQTSTQMANSANTPSLFENQINTPAELPEETTTNQIPARIPGAPSLLASLDLQEMDLPTTAPRLNIEAPKITPYTQRPRFRLGIHRSEMATSEQISRTIQRPNPMNDRRIFTGRMTNSGTTSITGISAAMDLKKAGFLESGINIRNTHFNIQHSANLQFKDRMNPPVNPPGNDYRFDYALSTASGLMEIEVRASQSDPGQAIGEDENIRIDIKTAHDIQYVSLPFLVGHRFGHGRLGLEAKVGLMANFLTGNTFNVTDIAIDHPRLHGSNTAGPKGKAPNLKQSTVDFMAAAGLSYEIGRSWSASISPTLLISSSSRHFDRYVQSKSVSAGVDFGLSYSF